MNQSWKSFFEFMYKYFSDDRSRVAYLRTLITQITTCSNNETDLIVNYPDNTLKNWIIRSIPKHVVSKISSRISYIELKNSMQRHFEQMNRTAKAAFFKECSVQLGLNDVSPNNFAEKIICLLFFLLDIPTNNQRNIRNNQLPLLELSNDYIDKFGACLLRDANNICMNKDCNNLLTYIDKNRTINNYQVLDLKMKTKTKAGRYENLIAVCPLCFERLQGHLSSEQTEYFIKLKQSHILQNEMQNLLLETNIDQSISKLLTQISNIGLHIENIEIKNPVKPSEKFDSSLDYGNKIQIEALVKSTYLFVRNIIKQLDENGEIKYELLQASVRLKYLQLKDRSTSQEEIFIQLVDYFKNISNQSDSVCRIVVSFFIQNCDVFEIPKGD